MKVIKGSLSVEGIKSIIVELEKLKQDIEIKTRQFSEMLADKGITVAFEYAQGDSHKFCEMVTFTKEYKGKKVYLVGKNVDLSRLNTHWYDADGNEHEETISPILALEWGTAGRAIKGHQGTASVTGNHVTDTQWMFYTDIDGNGNPINPHIATAEEAHEPMFHAYEEMKNAIKDVARKCFK